MVLVESFEGQNSDRSAVGKICVHEVPGRKEECIRNCTKWNKF